MQEKKDKILLFGYGRYGEQIGKYLLNNGYDVYIAESDKKNLKHASVDGYEHILIVDIENDEDIANTIFDNGIKKVFCAYDDEEVNIYLTITLKAIFSKIEIISICESKETERKLKLAGADKVIDTMEVAANKIYFILEKPAVAEAIDNILQDPNIAFYEIEIPKNSFLDGIDITDAKIKKRFDIIVIGIVDIELGNRFTFITKGIRHKLDAGDILVVIGKKDNIKKFQEELLNSSIKGNE
ncbi:NAD-binding protein [Nitrosophilus kaiyonis]|uniref:NAD-binding protein n=1 Tax=Nitrosophilus kaiyonis TaxID=2930200 RepID=UPI002491C734|nr:NAD-binding protein [Nitrosophilus kaiyonis]